MFDFCLENSKKFWKVVLMNILWRTIGDVLLFFLPKNFMECGKKNEQTRTNSIKLKCQLVRQTKSIRSKYRKMIEHMMLTVMALLLNWRVL